MKSLADFCQYTDLQLEAYFDRAGMPIVFAALKPGLYRTDFVLATLDADDAADAALGGDAIAERALPWLMPHAGPTLREVAQQTHPERAALAARILADSPR